MLNIELSYRRLTWKRPSILLTGYFEANDNMLFQFSQDLYILCRKIMFLTSFIKLILNQRLGNER